MEEKEQLMSQRPEEVVETYRQPVPGEVVERYSRPLPGRMTPPPPAERRKKRRTGLWIFLICLTVAVGIGAGLWIWDIFFADDPKDPFEYDYDFGWEEDASASQEITIPTYPTGEGVVLEVETDHGPELTAQEIYQRVNPSVVTVLAQLDGSVSVGTGVIFRSDGYILTNHHVLAGGRDCSITLDTGQSYEARYVAGDERNDLAVLKVELTGLPAATFGDSDQLAVGDRVYAIGNPLGVELRGTLTDGIVSAINRDVWVDGRTMTLIQTNAALNSGNSGGPLINAYGQVVGINTIKMMSGEDTIEGLGFAIPTSLAVRWVNEMIEFGEIQPQPVLGLSISLIPETLPDGGRGLEVVSVTPGLSGDNAGILVGDYIVSFAGQEVASTSEILVLRRELRIGDLVPVRIWRNGEYLDLTMEMMAEAD